MKKFMQEFRDFVLRGNVMNLAVGVIIGAAFQGVVTSLTENILSPIIGVFTQKNFDSLQLVLFAGSDAEGITLRYGAFLTSVINFLLMAWVVFLVVRAMSRLAAFGKKPEQPGAPATMQCPCCLTEIPYGASRCPHCTAVLEAQQVQAAKDAARKAAGQ